MSHHCHDEHSHSHDHSHGGHAHDHGDDITPAIQNTLYDQIDFDGIRCLNEATSGAGRAITKKTWAEREESAPELESDADEQLILHIPFTSQIRLHSIQLLTTSSSSAPRTVHLHINRDDLDFDNITSSSVKPTQSLELSQTNDVQDIGVKRALFNSVRSITLLVETSWGDEVSLIRYLGFRGDFLKLNKEGVSFLYEAAARPEDHKVKGEVGMGMGSGLGSGRRDF